jgi:hypothetical protein
MKRENFSVKDKELGLPPGTLEEVLRKVVLECAKDLFSDQFTPKIAELTAAVCAGRMTETQALDEIQLFVNRLVKSA